MIRHILKAVALSAALASTAQAAIITSANPTVFNFAGGGATAVVTRVSGFVAGQTATGTVAYYTEQNLGGTLVFTKTNVAGSANPLTDADVLDGFSILITVTSGSFEINPVAHFEDASRRDLADSIGVLGDQSGLNPPPTTNGVPEPASLLLVALAGLGLLATSRRRA